MEKIKKTLTNKEEPAVAEQPEQPSHKEKIKSQVLAKIGKPPRLDHVEVSHHHDGKYRVNIWERPEPNKNIAITIGPRIAWSYYLTVSDTGEIIHSYPPMIKLGSHA
jgi:ABC-type Zn2+ transport system substrate-binding protein/surface adhesin